MTTKEYDELDYGILRLFLKYHETNIKDWRYPKTDNNKNPDKQISE